MTKLEQKRTDELQKKVDRLVKKGYSFNFKQSDTIPYIYEVSITNKNGVIFSKKDGNPLVVKQAMLKQIEDIYEPLLEGNNEI